MTRQAYNFQQRMIRRRMKTGERTISAPAEPEESTRTTAEAAGTPTFKRFKRRQQYLVNVLKNLLQTVLLVRRRYNSNIPARPDIRILCPDITEKDNAALSIAAQRIVTAFAPLYNAKIIEPKEFIRLVYRFIAENVPEMIPEFAPINVRGGGGFGAKTPPDPGTEQPPA